MGKDAVEVRGLTKVYGDRVAVDHVSFSVARGEVFGILGPNGAGKTTTVETLEGYRVPGGGEVRVLGLDPRREGVRLRPRMGVMLQDDGLYPGIRPQEALRLFAAFYEQPEDPVRLLVDVGLAEAGRVPVRRLSGGQRRRLSLALALVGRPEIVFLDEPTASMDPRGRATAWQIVERLRGRGSTVVFTTQSMEEAERLADRLAVIDRGRLVALGTVGELTAGVVPPDTEFRARPGLQTAALASALGLDDGAVEEVRTGEYVVRAPADPDLVARLAGWLRDEGVTLGDLRGTRRSLEEVFLALTTESGASDHRRRGGATG